MKRYKILRQSPVDEREFKLIDLETDEQLNVDLYTNGNFSDFPQGADATSESWRAWLKDKFEGKEIEIERIEPYAYFIGGEAKIINPLPTN